MTDCVVPRGGRRYSQPKSCGLDNHLRTPLDFVVTFLSFKTRGSASLDLMSRVVSSDGRGDLDVQRTHLLGGACPLGKSHSVNAQNAPAAVDVALLGERHVSDSSGLVGPSGKPPLNKSVGGKTKKRKRPPGDSASTFLCRAVVKWLVARADTSFQSAQDLLTEYMVKRSQFWQDGMDDVEFNDQEELVTHPLSLLALAIGY